MNFEITKIRVQRLWQTQRTSTLWNEILKDKVKPGHVELQRTKLFNSSNLSYLINIFCVLCCDVCYDFSIKMMFRSSFPPDVSKKAYLRYLCLCAYSCVQHICVRVVFFFCVPYVASFTGWYIFSCPFGIVMPVTSRSVS